MLDRIETMHNNHYIHRDIKSENFVIGTGRNKGVLYIIDFGLSKRYRDPRSHQHI